jgi:hypothetical protein
VHIVDEYFVLLEDYIKEYGIPPENIWNMYEKGVQLGGGRKNVGVKYILSRHERSSQKVASAELELVTMVECVNAVGDRMKPGVVFQGVRQNRAWFTSAGSEEVGWCVINFH